MGLPLTWSLNICCQPKEQPFSTNIHAYSVHRLTHIHFSCVHVYLKANLYACCCCNFFHISSFLLFSLLLSSLALDRIKRLAVPSTDKAYDAEKEAEAKEKTKQALVEAFEASHAAAVKGKTAALHCTLHCPTGMVSQEGEGERERERERERRGEGGRERLIGCHPTAPPITREGGTAISASSRVGCKLFYIYADVRNSDDV